MDFSACRACCVNLTDSSRYAERLMAGLREGPVVLAGRSIVGCIISSVVWHGETVEDSHIYTSTLHSTPRIPFGIIPSNHTAV